ncbi:MAG: class I SAM-dependent methyltransferase, partial [Thalassolituus sp.]
LDDLETPRNGVSVLVAGCGTGRHALRLARYFNQMQVTAIDLSLTSLAYALWQAEKYRLNIDFIQGDILRAEMLGQTYDVIESSGVLHHMLVPEQGLNALIERLRPGGVMKLALYSRQARTLVRELRDELSGQIPETDAEIRTVREVLLQNQDQRWSAVLQSSDFYSLSGCRDLLFHTQEHTFDLQEVRRLIEKSGLEWIGIVPPAGARKWRQKNYG